jgi:hypothetical protein
VTSAGAAATTSRRPPGHYYQRSFPVLSAGPTPRTPLGGVDVLDPGRRDEARSWTWDEFTALHTDRSIDAAHKLREAGVTFALTSGRPPRGMQMLIEPLALDTPNRNLTHLREALGRAAGPRSGRCPSKRPTSNARRGEYAGWLPESFDLVHLGLGRDGHTASLVPGDPTPRISDRRRPFDPRRPDLLWSSPARQPPEARPDERRTREEARRRGRSAARRGRHDRLGTGSTVAHLLPALAVRGLDLRCVATSSATEHLARDLGIKVEPFRAAMALARLDVAIDGAARSRRRAGW